MPSSNKRGKVHILFLLAAALFGCWMVGTRYETAAVEKRTEIPATEEDMQKNYAYLAVTQVDLETEMTDPVEVNLSQIPDDYKITTGGEFHVTGELSGTLLINAAEENVHLFFDGISVTSVTGPAIYCQNANKLVITLMPGTENMISDSGSYPADENLEACIYSACDMTINGTGELTVNGYYKDAIRSRDIIKILDGVYTVKCKRTAIRGNDGILVAGGVFKISSEKYGFRTTKSGVEGRGNIMISGGELSIIAGRYAFVTDKANILIYNCAISERSVVRTFDAGGTVRVQGGCIT